MAHNIRPDRSSLREDENLTRDRILTLGELHVASRPLTKRGIAFSCDGELAVAGDDSFYVFVPIFPSFSHGPAEDAGTLKAEEDEDWFEHYRRNQRTQYSECWRRIPASPDKLDPRLNGGLFVTAGIPFPYDVMGPVHDERPGSRAENGERLDTSDHGSDDDDKSAAGSSASDASGVSAGSHVHSDSKREQREQDVGRDDDDDDDDDENDNDNDSAHAEHGFDYEDENSSVASSSSSSSLSSSTAQHMVAGAGLGPISGSGSSRNHVVSLAWSPSGLGVNRRPVLAVLTAAGTILIFGDSGSTASWNAVYRGREDAGGVIPRRELASWEILWGVGERLPVPGQKSFSSENIQGFAWAQGIFPGQALLAYYTDAGELAILGVQSLHVDDRAPDHAGADVAGAGLRTQQKQIWRVHELTRFRASGPHDMIDVSLSAPFPCALILCIPSLFPRG